ncbi:hypothetical protein PAXINDRAFT_20240 [Paxillus involutus ATCC 200175]|uniref:Uncharacterized protein n=1 Tax=Paxillus involutus ATCC 200175 TaxID=664439 RepID=A0A0C9SVF5_PAXIN|nr:hypothetical protein PAXINDRAFT_20240 [Paxillus involutus ATCC 200175]
MDQLRQQIDYLVAAKRKVEMEMEMEMEVKEPRRPQDLHTHTASPVAEDALAKGGKMEGRKREPKPAAYELSARNENFSVHVLFSPYISPTSNFPTIVIADYFHSMKDIFHFALDLQDYPQA